MNPVDNLFKKALENLESQVQMGLPDAFWL